MGLGPGAVYLQCKLHVEDTKGRGFADIPWERPQVSMSFKRHGGEAVSHERQLEATPFSV
jgi:hypothetical protein